MSTFKAALLTGHNQPLEIVELEHSIVDHQQRTCANGQVRLQMLVSGICGAQIGEIAGHKNPDAPVPRLLGHEGCGIIKEVGPGVSVQMVGKKAVVHWRTGDGPQANLPARYMTKNGSTVGGGHVTTFTESAVVSANRVTVVPDDAPDELCALLGCGLSTALGTIEQEAKVQMGESVLIVGCGGVGLNLILAAKLAQAWPIHVIDLSFAKMTLALKTGGTDYFAWADFESLKGHKYDVIVDTTGSIEAIESTLPLLSEKGRMVLLGQTKPNESFRVLAAVNHFHGEGHRIIWSQGGGFKPSSMIPRYLNLWRSGALDLTGIVSHRLPLEDINTGLDLVRAGQAGRIMIKFT